MDITKNIISQIKEVFSNQSYIVLNLMMTPTFFLVKYMTRDPKNSITKNILVHHNKYKVKGISNLNSGNYTYNKLDVYNILKKHNMVYRNNGVNKKESEIVFNEFDRKSR
jgi:hypothetical protein